MGDIPDSSNNTGEVNLRDINHRDGTAAAELIRIRASPSFRLGVLFIQAIENPLRIIRLPWDLIYLIWQIITQPKETGSVDKSTQLRQSIFIISGESMDDYRQERSIALASKLANQDTNIELVHLTLGTPMLEQRPSTLLEYSLPSSRMSKEIWGGFLSEQISLILATHRPSIIIYDGEYPHRGIVRALENLSNEHCIWIDPVNYDFTSNDEIQSTFESIIISRDIFVNKSLNNQQIKRISPLFKKIKSGRTKLVARGDLDIPIESLSVFFSPPSKPSTQQNQIYQEILQLLKSEKAHICMDPVSYESNNWAGNYPRALLRRLPSPISEMWLKAIDFAIIDGSQSAMLKMIDANVPTITIPRKSSRDNSEVRRSEKADKLGCAIMISDNQTSSWAVKKIMNPIKRRRMKEACSQQKIENGIQQLSEWLLQQFD